MKRSKKDSLPIISVIGLGKLGASYAAFYASKGFRVIGFDKDENKNRAINEGRAPVQETGLDALISENKGFLSTGSDIKSVVLDSSVSFIVTATPSKKNGVFSLQFVLDAAQEIGKALKEKSDYHLIGLVSTVLPEDARKEIIPMIERYSGKKCGADFGYCYNPSLIALGDILENLSNPDFLFLGSFDKRSGDTLEAIYGKIYPHGNIERMSIESAEIAKISLNSFVTTKITFANMLGQLCAAIPDADVDEITNALGKDKRIGRAYFRSGLGYGGPCFPRDNFAFAQMAMSRGIATPLALATHNINILIPMKVAKFIKSIVGKDSKIGMLGVSYKPRTTICEESQALSIAAQLIKDKYKVIVYESLGNDEAKKEFGKRADYASSMKELVNKSDVIFLSNPDKAFRELPGILKGTKKPKTVIDPWGMFRAGDFNGKVDCISMGRRRSPKTIK